MLKMMCCHPRCNIFTHSLFINIIKNFIHVQQLSITFLWEKKIIRGVLTNFETLSFVIQILKDEGQTRI